MSNSEPLLVGWREWVALPDLGIPAIKVKIDTGARTSALHAFDMRRMRRDGGDWITFSVEPLQRNHTVICHCEAPLVDIRNVTDSGGHVESRYVVSCQLVVGCATRVIELTLTERHNMLFRMLVGRTALAQGIVVDPAGSYLTGRLSPRLLYSSSSEEN